MDGVPSIVDQPTSLEWPVDKGTRRDTPAAGNRTESDEGAATESDESSGERLLWARSREFDWGDGAADRALGGLGKRKRDGYCAIRPKKQSVTDSGDGLAHGGYHLPCTVSVRAPNRNL